MKDYRGTQDEINSRIVRNVNYLMQKNNHSANEFCTYCREKHQIYMNSGNISKLLHGKLKVNILTLSLLAEWLEVDIQALLWEEMCKTEWIIEKSQVIMSDNVFIMSNDNNDFDKYKGKYYCYFYPTVSDDNNLICGTMEIKICEYTKKCGVTLEIDTNEKNDDGKPYIKRYEGSIILSKEKKICHCIVCNEELGECNFLMFRHVRPNRKQYIGGMAAVLTISAGGANVPTFHRMLISKEPILEMNKKLILGNLFLNWSKITVEVPKLEKVLSELGLNQEIQKKIIDNSNKKDVYELSERYLRSISKDDIAPYTHAELIAHIREASIALKYVKISQKLDEHIVEILEKIQGK